MTGIQSAIEHFGGATALSRALGVSPQAVCFWRDAKRKVPPEVCISIERLTGGVVRCEAIRSDVDWAYIRNSKPGLAPAQAIIAPAATENVAESGAVADTPKPFVIGAGLQGSVVRIWEKPGEKPFTSESEV